MPQTGSIQVHEQIWHEHGIPMNTANAVAPPGGDGLPPLPYHTRPLGHQVAGHVYGKGKSKLGLLDCGDGTIFKPLQSGRRGSCELDFYRCIFDPASTDCTLLKMRPLLPRFLGTFVSPQQPDVTYLHLEDLAKGFKGPCVADIKIGRITYDPDATPKKRATEEAKYPPQKVLGFQFRGMRLYNQSDNSFPVHTKEELRQYDETEILSKAFAVFFSDKSGIRKNVVAACLEKVRTIQTWFEEQKRYSFFASSVLFVYEGHQDPSGHSADRPPVGLPVGDHSSNPHELSTNHKHRYHPGCEDPVGDSTYGNSVKHSDCVNQLKYASGHQASEGETTTVWHKESSPCSDVVVKMIDFAHVFKIDQLDENYLWGIRNVVKYLERLIDLADDGHTDVGNRGTKDNQRN